MQLMLHFGLVFGFFRFDDVRNHTMDLRQGRKSIENALRLLESHRFREVVRRLRDLKVRLKGFYHTSAWRGEWRAVMSEQLQLLDGKREQLNGLFDRERATSDGIEWGRRPWTSLLEHSEELHVTVASSKPSDLDLISSFIGGLDLTHKERLKFVFNETLPRGSFGKLSPQERDKLMERRSDLSEGESATFLALYDYCTVEEKAGRKSFVYYFHTKGACCTRKTEKLGARCVTTWREAMNAFALEFPSICLRALLDGYDSCGMENQEGTYSGNFWYANCDAVANLLPLSNRFDAYKVEYGIFQYTTDARKNEEHSYKCGYSTYNCYVNHYEKECPRSSYIHKLTQYGAQYELPPNFDGTKSENRLNSGSGSLPKAALLKECAAAR